MPRGPTPSVVVAGRRRAVAALSLVAAGLLIARAAPAIPSLWWFILAAVAGALALILRAWPCRAALALAVLTISGGWFTLRIHEAPRDSLSRALTESRRDVLTIEGTVLRAPEHSPGARGRLAPFLAIPPITRFPLRADTVIGAADERTPVSGILHIRVNEQTDDPRPGSRIRVTGLVSPVERPSNPGQRDARPWAAQQRIVGYMQAPTRAHILPADPPRALTATLLNRFIAWREGLRAATRRILASAIGGASDPSSSPRTLEQADSPGRALLAALLIGEESEPLREVQSSFFRLGLTHILSISGLHVAALAWAAMAFLRAAGARSWLEPLLVAAVVTLYLLVVPAQSPVLRAGAMTLIFLLAESTCRRYDRITLLAWIAVGSLAWRPMELWSAGWQLSFGIVAALMTLYPIALERWWGDAPDPSMARFHQRALWAAKGSLTVSLVAWAVSAPCIAFHFGLLSPLGAPVSALLVPPMMALLCAGFAMTLVSAALPSAGALLGPLLTICADAVASISFALDKLPGMVLFLPRIGLAWTILATVLIIWWLASPRAPRTPAARLARRTRLALAILLAAWLTPSFFTSGLARSTALRIDTLDVGDGACHLVRTHSGALLWDCGSLRLTVGERDIPRAVRALGAWRVPTVVISHPNLDHYSGLLDVLDPLSVRTVIVGRAFLDAASAEPDSAPAHVLSELRRRNIEIRSVSAGDVLDPRAFAASFLSPPTDTRFRRANNASLVALFQAQTNSGPRRLLLTGDIEDEAIAFLMTEHPDLRADAMEAPHHGSARESAFAFVLSLNPAVVMQSTGDRRVGDERWDDVKQDRRWWTTATDGAISVEFRRDGAVVDQPFRPRD